MRDEVCLVISNRFTTEDGITGKGDAKLCKPIRNSFINVFKIKYLTNFLFDF